jgi:ATP-dependent RNA helicase DHX8/PRP22
MSNPVNSPQELPLRRELANVVRTVEAGLVSIIIGETGSGKTTQLPQILIDVKGLLPEGAKIAVTQPRRVAAVAVARRVAQERGTRLGCEVGYSVRFDDCHCDDTRLKYLTDGTLLREMLTDAQLMQYAAVVLDEAHERSLNTDILFALLKRLVAARANTNAQLRVVVMSATMDAERLSAFFGGCPILRVLGRQFPVEIIYTEEDHEHDYAAAAVSVVVDIHQHQAPGDILVFLSGQAEIEKAARLIAQEVC